MRRVSMATRDELLAAVSERYRASGRAETSLRSWRSSQPRRGIIARRKDFSRTDPGKPANALVGVVPTNTGLSLQCLGNKLVALLRSWPSFLQIGWRIGFAEGRRLIFRYMPLCRVVLRRVIGLTLHTRSKPTRQKID